MEVVADQAIKREVIFDEAKIQKTRALMSKPFLFRLSMLYLLPMGFLSGMTIKSIDNRKCVVRVKYKFLNKNPFKTTYWAVLGMAAELAGGALLLSFTRNVSPSVATYVVGCDAKFVNRALGVTTFECNEGELIKEKVKEAAETGEGVTFKTSTTGYSKDGTTVADFVFTWSVKGREK